MLVYVSVLNYIDYEFLKTYRLVVIDIKLVTEGLPEEVALERVFKGGGGFDRQQDRVQKDLGRIGG